MNKKGGGLRRHPLIEPAEHLSALVVDFDFLAAAVLGAFSVQPRELVNELGKLVNVHHVNREIVGDIGKGVGMDILAEAAPDALKGVTTDAQGAAHKGSAGSFDGNVHAVQLNVAVAVVGGAVMLGAADAVVSAERKLSLVALGLAAVVAELIDVESSHFFNLLFSF